MERSWLDGDERAVEEVAPGVERRGSLERSMVLAVLDELTDRRREEIASIERLADLLRDAD